jgi:hypothetical protein
MAVYRNLIVASTASGGPTVKVPVHGAVDLQQTYTELRARTILRKADGGAVLRQSWSGKLRTEISGKGLVPPGLQALCSTTGTVTVSCAALRSVRSASNVITIPSARRTDLAITTKAGASATGKSWYARQWDGDRYATATGTTASGTGHNVVSITLASGEAHDSYEVLYAPKFTGYAELTADNFVQNDGWSWQLVVEEA